MSKKKQAKPKTIEGLSQEASAFYSELQKESDRGAVLVAAAFLEETLGLMLRAAFIEESEPADWLLSEKSNGPIASFAVRTKLSYCLGLLGREMYEDLNTIREIRNDFAHEHQSLSFRDQSIADRCRKLKTWEKFQPGPEWNLTSRDCVFLAVTLLADQLLLRALSLQHARRGEDFQVGQRLRVT